MLKVLSGVYLSTSLTITSLLGREDDPSEAKQRQDDRHTWHQDVLQLFCDSLYTSIYRDTYHLCLKWKAGGQHGAFLGRDRNKTAANNETIWKRMTRDVNPQTGFTMSSAGRAINKQLGVSIEINTLSAPSLVKSVVNYVKPVGNLERWRHKDFSVQ